LPRLKTQQQRPQKLRIIGGQWRSRQISFTSAPGLRPTGDRIRETLFNWLAADIPGARCLDLFAGSGALCFEALSRGAASCTAVELDGRATKQMRENQELLQANNISIVMADARHYLQQSVPQQPYHIVFIDPPFESQLQGSVCAALNNNRWLAPNALIYCELPTSDCVFVAPTNWQLLHEKRAGEVKYSLYSCIEPMA